MVIKIETHIYADVTDDEQAQELCNILDIGLADRLGGLPLGSLESVQIECYTKPTDDELREKGLTEE